MALDHDLWGKKVKPLPAPAKPKVKDIVPTGMVRKEDYEGRQCQQAFKKGKAA